MLPETTIHDSHHRASAPLAEAGRRRLVATIVVASLLAIALPAIARADSVAFVRGGDVWLSTGDFTREYRVTFTGGYSDVSQADDGTMIALSGVRLHRLDRTGRVLADFDTPVSDTRPAPVKTFYGPYDPAISPDGSKVAYTYYYLTQSQNSTCFPPACVTTINEGGTGYSHADRQTAWDEPGLGKHSGWRHPTWIDDDEVLISDPTHAFNYDVLTDTIGDTGVPIKEWFTDNATSGLHGGEMTRQQTKAAFVGGQSDEELRIYAMGGPPPLLPTACYAYSGPSGGRYGMPSWSPDGTRLVTADADGVKLVSVPDFAGGCTTAGATPTAQLVLAGGSEPDWGPADVPPRRPDPVPDGGVPGGSPGGGAPGGGPGSGPGTPAARIAVPAARLGAALRRGLLITVSGARPGTLRVEARSGARLIAAGTATVDASGRATVRLRFTASARRRLASKRTVRLTVRAPGIRSAVLTLRR